MNWLDEWKANQNTSPKQRPVESQCPDCGGEALIWRVRKEGPNCGRPILFCADKTDCKLTKFMDVPKCDLCGEEKMENTVRKNGNNKGRRYQVCPNNCEGSFR